MWKKVRVCVFCNRIVDLTANALCDSSVCPGHCHAFWLAVKDAAIPLAGIVAPQTGGYHSFMLSAEGAARHAKRLMDSVQRIADEDGSES